MRLAIISDVHLGDSMSVMVLKDSMTCQIQLGSKYDAFKNKVKTKFGGEELDYLVLLGDILDFSVSSYSDAYAIGKFFFQQLKDDGIAKEIIYIPGNHDFDLWHTVEYQINVTQRLERGKLPIPFRMSIPAIIDDRKSTSNSGFTLFNVSRRKESNKPKYAGLFMDHITTPATPFNFVFPNIYFITDNETVLITHGQYQEAYWSILGRWGLKIINGDLDIKNQAMLDMKEMVAINFPLCQLGCSAIGQAGPLTRVIQKLEHELKEHETRRLEPYFHRFEEELNKLGFFKGFKGLLKKIGFDLIRKELLKTLGKTKKARYNKTFMEDPFVRARFKEFFDSTAYEIDEIKEKCGIDFPLPQRMIFGHTHQPIPWGASTAPKISLPQLHGKELVMYNTGGWLNHLNKETKEMVFCGAEIFFYQTGEGFSSESVGYSPMEIHN